MNLKLASESSISVGCAISFGLNGRTVLHALFCARLLLLVRFKFLKKSVFWANHILRMPFLQTPKLAESMKTLQEFRRQMASYN